MTRHRGKETKGLLSKASPSSSKEAAGARNQLCWSAYSLSMDLWQKIPHFSHANMLPITAVAAYAFAFASVRLFTASPIGRFIEVHRREPRRWIFSVRHPDLPALFAVEQWELRERR